VLRRSLETTLRMCCKTLIEAMEEP
jgi:hypothetical protein